jgi:hypothetical protein
MPVLSSMYGADEPFRIVLVAGHLLGLVSATVWWRSSRRMRERIGVGVLLGWYLLPVAMRAVGMADGRGP